MHTRKYLKPSLDMNKLIHNNVGRPPNDKDILHLMRQLYEMLTPEGREKLHMALKVYPPNKNQQAAALETFNRAAATLISLKAEPAAERQSHKAVKGWGG